MKPNAISAAIISHQGSWLSMPRCTEWPGYSSLGWASVLSPEGRGGATLGQHDQPRSAELGAPGLHPNSHDQAKTRDWPRLTENPRSDLKIGVALGPCGFKSRPGHR